jgi:hypothetical protein
LRRLFSTFARGWPGVGLLLLRLIAAVAMMNQGAFRFGSSAGSLAWAVLALATGLLLFVGLWTPIAGVLALALEIWAAFVQPGDHWIQLLLGTLGAGLALVGPGVWSVDARLFGWKRIGSRPR